METEESEGELGGGVVRKSFLGAPPSRTAFLTDFPYLSLKGISDHSRWTQVVAKATVLQSSLPWKPFLWHNINIFLEERDGELSG